MKLKPIFIDGPLKGKEVEIERLTSIYIPVLIMADGIWNTKLSMTGEISQVRYEFFKFLILGHIIVIGTCENAGFLETRNHTPLDNELFDILVSDRGKQASYEMERR